MSGELGDIHIQDLDHLILLQKDSNKPIDRRDAW